MSEQDNDLGAGFFVAASERDPVKAARDPARPLPKRFYETATVGGGGDGFEVLLDGRPVNTPARRRVLAPVRALAEALASEWASQGETINPASMPLTRLTNTVIDGVADQMMAVEAELMKYAASDLICYRAGEPEGLVAAQAGAWDPILNFARDQLGARLALAEGVMFVAQSDEALLALTTAARDCVGKGPAAAFRLAALYEITTLTGSLAMALALAHGAISVESAWAAAHVDEDFQMRAWGADAEALARRERRFVDMQAAAFMARATAVDS